MRICHCLFWKQNNKIAVIYKGNNKMDVLKIKGEVFIDYTEDFWELWKDYSGYCKGDLTDFCFIYDKPMEIQEEYQVESCDSNNSIWTIEKIRSVSEMLQLTNAIDICNENNEYIIEEIKSTSIELEEITTDYHKEHLAQLKIYAYLYSLQNNIDKIHTRLTYISIVDYETKSFDAIYSNSELEDFTFKILEEYINWLNLYPNIFLKNYILNYYMLF